MDNKELLWLIIRTLETVEVRGRENLDKLLGCILQLEKMANDSKDTPKAAPEAEEPKTAEGSEEAK